MPTVKIENIDQIPRIVHNNSNGNLSGLNSTRSVSTHLDEDLNEDNISDKTETQANTNSSIPCENSSLHRSVKTEKNPPNEVKKKRWVFY